MNLQYKTPSSGRAASTAHQGLLRDKVAVLTGAASGIGKEIAFAFAREGAKVAIADLDQPAAYQAASEIDPRLQRALGVAMDVSDEQQVEAGMARVLETFGRIDVLISNAGVQIVAPVADFEFDKLEEASRDPSGWRIPDHSCRTAADVRAEEWQHHLHGIRAFEGGVAAQSSLRDGQARLDRSGKGRSEGRRRARRPRKRDLPWVRPHAVGREANSRAGQQAWDLRS